MYSLLLTDVFGWPRSQCTYPAWITRNTWRDLSGRFLYQPNDMGDVIQLNFRQTLTSQPEVNKSFRCYRLLGQNTTTSQSVAVSFLLAGWLVYNYIGYGLTSGLLSPSGLLPVHFRFTFDPLPIQSLSISVQLSINFQSSAGPLPALFRFTSGLLLVHFRSTSGSLLPLPVFLRFVPDTLPIFSLLYYRYGWPELKNFTIFQLLLFEVHVIKQFFVVFAQLIEISVYKVCQKKRWCLRNSRRWVSTIIYKLAYNLIACLSNRPLEFT